MQIGKDSVVIFHYSLRDESGSEIETSRDGDPTAILYGYRNVISGLENALKGREAGDTFSVTLQPHEAYGPRADDKQQRLSKKYFANPRQLKAGSVTVLRTESGTQPVTVIKVGSKFIDVDLNHPQAGKVLQFDLEILEVRAATAEEVAHKHAHHGHNHH